MAEDETDAYSYPNGRETAGGPTMFSHEAHRNPGKKTETNGKPEERQKQKGCYDEEEKLEPFSGSGF
jgi:hypothetical protein